MNRETKSNHSLNFHSSDELEICWPLSPSFYHSTPDLTDCAKVSDASNIVNRAKNYCIEQQVVNSSLNTSEISLNLRQLLDSINDQRNTNGSTLNFFTDLYAEMMNGENFAESEDVKSQKLEYENGVSEKKFYRKQNCYDSQSMAELTSLDEQSFYQESLSKRKTIDADENDNLSSCSELSIIYQPSDTKCFRNDTSLQSPINEKNVKRENEKSLPKFDKDSEEYKKRREMNNMAVRKSREKMKQRAAYTYNMCCELQKTNDKLRGHVEKLQNELNAAKSFLVSLGFQPEIIDDEIQKRLRPES
ncbi:CCAAT/enhancer-binding-like protein [Dinothrombium tinctorium]|uniref:CCAAT/enhancer-binding-like protein n=1 Tax=Dinothrombium tinctorium TaxID=1965070 RepID=A0A443R9S1_9ACAR|nr:CCAAT/enhancer-binding-like protein [Dinothrombium tinctorium]